MAVTLSTIVAKDGAGSTIVGGVQAIDLSGAGTGPWSPGNVILDGLLGVQRAAVKAASTAPVATDPALVVAISPNSVNANGQATKANSAPVIVAGAGTGTQTSVASGTSDVTILAANTARSGAAVYNDDANGVYLLLANATSSATNYSILLPANGYYETPFGYTGIIKGIWVADGSGSARVTEFT